MDPIDTGGPRWSLIGGRFLRPTWPAVWDVHTGPSGLLLANVIGDVASPAYTGDHCDLRGPSVKFTRFSAELHRWIGPPLLCRRRGRPHSHEHPPKVSGQCSGRFFGIQHLPRLLGSALLAHTGLHCSLRNVHRVNNSIGTMLVVGETQQWPA